MKKLPLIFLHGFSSSRKSRKGNYLAEWVGGMPGAAWHAVDFNPTPADFEYMSISGMIDRVRQYCLLQGIEHPNLIGNSLGGLIATHYAARYGAAKVALLAPVLRYWRFGMTDEAIARWESQGYIEFEHSGFRQAKLPLRWAYHLDAQRFNTTPAPAARTMIIHGQQDEVIPIESSRAYAAQYPDQVSLHEIESDHGMMNVLPDLSEMLIAFFELR